MSEKFKGTCLRCQGTRWKTIKKDLQFQCINCGWLYKRREGSLPQKFKKVL